MPLTIRLPERETVLAKNRQRWAEVLADPQWRDHPYRIETNGFGQIVMTPPPSGSHSTRQYRIARQLEMLLGEQSLTECPVVTADGTKAVDAAWYSPQRFGEVRGQLAFEEAPEICVEVVSPSNTPDEIKQKFRLYFDAGAEECWQCDVDGNMTYCEAANPDQPINQSKRCSEFPKHIED
jgi:Uma2 family endonuclease